jgi:hypothetical protein
MPWPALLPTPDRVHFLPQNKGLPLYFARAPLSKGLPWAAACGFPTSHTVLSPPALGALFWTFMAHKVLSVLWALLAKGLWQSPDMTRVVTPGVFF